MIKLFIDSQTDTLYPIIAFYFPLYFPVSINKIRKSIQSSYKNNWQ